MLEDIDTDEDAYADMDYDTDEDMDDDIYENSDSDEDDEGIYECTDDLPKPPSFSEHKESLRKYIAEVMDEFLKDYDEDEEVDFEVLRDDVHAIAQRENPPCYRALLEDGFDECFDFVLEDYL